MSGTSLRVLIADDTPDIRNLLRIVLETGSGFDVVAEAADGIEAIAGVGTHRPDAVLLDLSMPRMDGLEAIPEIRRVSPATRIVVLSAFEASVMADEALSRGAHAYIPKGTASATILTTLRDVCTDRAPAGGRD